MALIGRLSDRELRMKLAEYGYPVGPVTETSRKVLFKKLNDLMLQSGLSDKGRSSSRFSYIEKSGNEDTKSSLYGSVPSANLRPKSMTKSSSSNLPAKMGQGKMNLRNDLFTSPNTSTPESEAKENTRIRFSVPAVTLSNTDARRSTIHAKSSPNIFKDGLVTGSDSDIDSYKHKINTIQNSGGGDSPDSVTYTSSISRLSSVKPNQRSNDSGGGSNSGNTQKAVGKSFPSTTTANNPDNWFPIGTTSTLFKSKSVGRLSDCSAMDGGCTYDKKEGNDVGKSLKRNLGPQSTISREHKTTENKGKSSFNFKVVSMPLTFVGATLLAVLAIIYVSLTSKNAVNFGLEDHVNNFPLCKSDTEPSGEQMPDEICLEHQEIIPAVKMAKILIPELIKKAVSHQCSYTSTPIMTQQDAIKYLKNKETHRTSIHLERYFRAMKVLFLSNPHWGITVLDIDGLKEDKSNHKHLVHTSAFLVTDPDLPLLCYLKLRVLALLKIASILVLGLIGLFSSWAGIKWYVRRRESDKLEICNLVDQIIHILVRHQESAANSAPVYIPVNHVRDELIPLTDRIRLAPLWENAVKYIHDHESRIRCDIQLHDGEKVAVWSWLSYSAYRKI